MKRKEILLNKGPSFFVLWLLVTDTHCDNLVGASLELALHYMLLPRDDDDDDVDDDDVFIERRFA